MDWELAIEQERQWLKRYVALFLSLAMLADRACDRPLPIRMFVLWVLRPAEAVALRYVFGAWPDRPFSALIRRRRNSLAEARRYARCFRMAAHALSRELKLFERCMATDEPEPIDEAGRSIRFTVSRQANVATSNWAAHDFGLPRFIERLDSS